MGRGREGLGQIMAVVHRCKSSLSVSVFGGDGSPRVQCRQKRQSRFRFQTWYNRKGYEANKNQEKKQEGLSVPQEVWRRTQAGRYTPLVTPHHRPTRHGPTTRYVSSLDYTSRYSRSFFNRDLAVGRSRVSPIPSQQLIPPRSSTHPLVPPPTTAGSDSATRSSVQIIPFDHSSQPCLCAA